MWDATFFCGVCCRASVKFGKFGMRAAVGGHAHPDFCTDKCRVGQNVAVAFKRVAGAVALIFRQAHGARHMPGILDEQAVEPRYLLYEHALRGRGASQIRTALGRWHI